MIKAIETRYGGCLFRSRIEARWAVYLDTLGIRWQYEAEGYDMDGVRYLPDFWLPDFQMWIEVKGKHPLDGGTAKAAVLAKETSHPVIVAWGFEQEDNVYFWTDDRGRFWRAEGYAFDEFHGYPFQAADLERAEQAAKSARFER